MARIRFYSFIWKFCLYRFLQSDLKCIQVSICHSKPFVWIFPCTTLHILKQCVARLNWAKYWVSTWLFIRLCNGLSPYLSPITISPLFPTPTPITLLSNQFLWDGSIAWYLGGRCLVIPRLVVLLEGQRIQLWEWTPAGSRYDTGKPCPRACLMTATVKPKAVCLADKHYPCPRALEWQGKWASAHIRLECLCGIVLINLIDVGRPIWIVGGNILWTGVLYYIRWRMASWTTMPVLMHCSLILTVGVTWPVLSTSRHSDFPAMMDCNLELWTK